MGGDDHGLFPHFLDGGSDDSMVSAAITYGKLISAHQNHKQPRLRVYEHTPAE